MLMTITNFVFYFIALLYQETKRVVVAFVLWYYSKIMTVELNMDFKILNGGFVLPVYYLQGEFMARSAFGAKINYLHCDVPLHCDDP